MRTQEEFADYLHELARRIQSGRMEKVPSGVLVVFENDGGHEVLWCGLNTRKRLRDAGLEVVHKADLIPGKKIPALKLFA